MCDPTPERERDFHPARGHEGMHDGVHVTHAHVALSNIHGDEMK